MCAVVTSIFLREAMQLQFRARNASSAACRQFGLR